MGGGEKFLWGSCRGWFWVMALFGGVTPSRGGAGELTTMLLRVEMITKRFCLFR